jgi:hypothetical protein
MKRFFCTECKRVVRVRRLPEGISINTSEAFSPVDRFGTCDFHNGSLSRPTFQSRQRIVKAIKKVSAIVNTPKKGKR